MSLSKEKNFADSKVSVNRRGCGFTSVKGATGGGSGGAGLQTASPITVRASWTTTVWWDITNVLNPFPENTMKWGSNLVMNFTPPSGVPIVNGSMSAGITNTTSTGLFGARPLVSQLSRLGTNIMPVSTWATNHANYVMTGKILLSVPVSLISSYNVSIKWDWAGHANVWSSGVQADNPLDLSGTYTLQQLSQSIYTVFSINTAKLITTYSYTLGSSQSTTMYRRSPDASDTVWINTPL